MDLLSSVETTFKSCGNKHFFQYITSLSNLSKLSTELSKIGHNSITALSGQGSFAKQLSLLFLTPRPALSSHQHRTLVCLFWSGNLHYAHSPANPTTTLQECFELLDVSNRETIQGKKLFTEIQYVVSWPAHTNFFKRFLAPLLLPQAVPVGMG